MNKKLLRTLDNVCLETDCPISMYPGGRYDLAPVQHRKLERMGLVEPFIPHNPIHKERVTITDKGRAVLKEHGIQSE